MKALTVGMMMIMVFVVGTKSARAQGCALIYTFVQLTDECDGGNPLPDGTSVCLYWDQDNDGPDETDPLPDFGIFPCFGMNGLEYLELEGTFYTDPSLCFIGVTPTPNAFYFRVHIGGVENLCWTSEVIAIPSGYSEIELQDWTCGPCPEGDVPGPVTGLTATQDLCNAVEVSWNPTPWATSYRVYADGSLIAVVSSTSFYHYDLLPGVNCYSYQVQAQNEIGNGPISEPAQGCASTAPLAPVFMSASEGLCGVTITYRFDSYAGVESVEILREDSVIVTLDPRQPGQLVTYRDLTPLPVAALYSVQAWSTCGYGPFLSDSGSSLPMAGQPTQVNATDSLCGFVHVSWLPAENAEGYIVSREGHQFEIPGNQLEYVDVPPQLGRSYTYYVTAFNDCNHSGAPETDIGRAGGVMSAPVTFAASTTHNDHILLTWTNLPNVAAFEVLRSEFSHAPRFEVIAQVPAESADHTNFADYGAAPDQYYLYQVRGFDDVCGPGPESVRRRGRRATVEPVIFGEVRVTDNLSGAMSAHAADIDDDGDMDIVGAGMFADKVAWYENDGQWNFTEHVLLDRWQGARAVGVADLDSDGDQDIAAISTFQNALVWLEQHPDGFWFHHISSDVMGPTDILVGRTLSGLNSEIVTTAGASGEISRWFYDGDAPFTRQSFATNMPGARSLDFGRGALPSGVWLTAAAAGSGELVWWQSFNGYQRVSLGFHPGVVACGGALMDVVTDSLMDVFFCTADGFLGWLDREFGEVHEITSILDSPRDVTSGLMDRDDRQDLVVASGHEITWWRNTRNRFYRNVVTDNLPQATSVEALDLDDDGDLDILATGDNEIRLYLSTLRDLDNITELVPAPDDEHDGQAFGLPTTFALDQNYPNPFNAQTTLRFALPEASFVSLAVYDLTGRQVAQLVNGNLDAGYHAVSYNATTLASGVYFYRLEAGQYLETRKMVLLK